MYFPITVIDNFYDNFNDIKNYVNSLEFNQKETFTMPGTTTKFLLEFDNSFFLKSTGKLLSLFYDRKIIKNINYGCRTRFEKIYPYGKEYDKAGWIHTDDENKLSAILYLNGEYDEGTSFYVNKGLGVCDYSLMNYKEELYKKNFPDPKQYNELLSKHNNQFKEILKVPLLENRLVVFDSSIYHKSDGLGTEKNPRLIQTFFFDTIRSDTFPISEMKRYIT